MDNIAIKVENVSKSFRLPHEKSSSVKSAFVNFYRRNRSYELQQALRDVSFEIKKGEFFGIVGRNGSGKSTMLKMLAGIYTPTGGNIQVNGKLTPFIELGVGFNPELTGRENVYLNGALLGFNRTEMKRMYKDIVKFAELEKFMDQKLKNYSSGMQVRLAFSIAIRAQSEVLLIDEVLAVGDVNFQRKCYDIFDDIKKSGRTVVFVTHDMSAVKRYCDRVIMLDKGSIAIEGTPDKVAVAYEIENLSNDDDRKLAPGSNELKRLSSAPVKLIAIDLVDKKKGKNAISYTKEEPILIDFEYECTSLKEITFAFNFTRRDGLYICGHNTKEGLGPLKLEPGKGKIRCRVEPGQLTEGAYFVNGTIYEYQNFALVDFMDAALGTKVPIINIVEPGSARDGIFHLEASWSRSSK